MGNQEGMSWKDVPIEDVFEGIARQTVAGESFTLVRYTYQPGSVFPEHSHPEEQFTIVHSGAIEFTVGGETLLLKEGMFATIPPGVPHGARIIGDQAVVTDNYIASATRTGLRWTADSS